EKARAKICELTAYWADQYRVPWSAFPAIEAEGGRSFVIWHTEFTAGTGKMCPFEVVQAETNDLIARTKDLLKGYQTSGRPPATSTPTTTAPPTSEYPAHRVPAPDTISAQGIRLVAMANPRFRCVKGTTVRTYPNRQAPAGTKTPCQAGKDYTFDYATEDP